MFIPEKIQQAISQGALVVANHSGGKDSQAMLIKLLQVVPRHQLLVVHASLGEMEWEGAKELAQRQALAAGLPFMVAEAQKTLLDMVERRHQSRPGVPSWPSASSRQCTSDLKRDPIAKVVRRYAKENGFSVVVNCMGLRAEESASRAKKKTWQRVERNCTKTREWLEWLPVHEMTTPEVFDAISEDEQEPHAAYALGNDRLSCVFCIMASKEDLANGARRRPELLAKYDAMEKRTGYTMHQSRIPLVDLVAQGEAILQRKEAA